MGRWTVSPVTMKWVSRGSNGRCSVYFSNRPAGFSCLFTSYALLSFLMFIHVFVHPYISSLLHIVLEPICHISLVRLFIGLYKLLVYFSIYKGHFFHIKFHPHDYLFTLTRDLLFSGCPLTNRTGSSRCDETEFVCDSGQCIPSTWRCDEAFDCFDHSDELACNETTCQVNYIHCNKVRIALLGELLFRVSNTEH